jgi:hypothetical protein
LIPLRGSLFSYELKAKFVLPMARTPNYRMTGGLVALASEDLIELFRCFGDEEDAEATVFLISELRGCETSDETAQLRKARWQLMVRWVKLL